MKKYLFDSATIIPALLAPHPHHKPCMAWCEKVLKNKIQGFLSTHGLAELYSNLTRLPFQPKISPHSAETMINKSVLKIFQTVDLSPKNYRDAISLCSQINGMSGIIYDALHVQAALKKDCIALVTPNERDFIRFKDHTGLEVINPLTTKP